MRPARFLSRHGTLLTAVLVVLALYGMAQPSRPTAEEQAEMAACFVFTPLAIPRPEGFREREVRPVHPSMERISAWVSAMGAAATLSDVDGDGQLDLIIGNTYPDGSPLLDAQAVGVMVMSESTSRSINGGRNWLLLWAGAGSGEAPQVRYRDASDALDAADARGWTLALAAGDLDGDGVLEAIQATGFVKGRVNRWPELQALGTANDSLLRDPRNWPRFQPSSDISGHNPNAFFVRDRHGRYHDIAALIGLGGAVVTRGIASADVDGDGDLDFVLANQGEDSTFYRNDAARRQDFLGLNMLLPAAQGRAPRPSAPRRA